MCVQYRNREITKYLLSQTRGRTFTYLFNTAQERSFLEYCMKEDKLFTGELSCRTETQCFICYEDMHIEENIVQCDSCKKCVHLECRNKWKPLCIYCKK